MQEHSVLCLSQRGFHRMAYVVWPSAVTDGGTGGDPVPLVCVHGLTRNGRDFDALALALSGAGRDVVCPDVVGRGRSDWLADPAGYGVPQYAADMATLIARLDVPAVDWLGTSMGGLVGMALAAQPGTPIRRLILNDVGPVVPQAALQRIADYVGLDPAFDDVDALDAYLRQVHAPFGPLTAEQWRHLATHSARQKPDGGLALAYDPGIATPFRNQPIEDIDLWPLWEAIRCPVLVIRGADSDLLSAETAEGMRERGPRAQVHEVASCGHAPPLMADDQIQVVRDWLHD